MAKANTAAPWLDRALTFVGTKEKPGRADNKVIVAWFKYSGLPESYWHDQTAWCKIYINAMLELSGYKSDRNAMARATMRFGEKCAPKRGALMVMPRGKPPSGHIGIVESVEPNGKFVHTVEGNVGDRVVRKRRRASTALGFRWPVEKLKPKGPLEVIAVPAKAAVKAVKEVVKAPSAAVKTAARSKSVWVQASAAAYIGWGYMGNGFEWLFVKIQAFVSFLPTFGADVAPTVFTSQQFAGWLGIPWAKVSLGLVVGLMAVVAARHIRDKMKLEELTK